MDTLQTWLDIILKISAICALIYLPLVLRRIANNNPTTVYLPQTGTHNNTPTEINWCTSPDRLANIKASELKPQKRTGPLLEDKVKCGGCGKRIASPPLSSELTDTGSSLIYKCEHCAATVKLPLVPHGL